jgi:hypothetical protein
MLDTKLDDDTEYIRADVVKRMIADEREACARIAQRMADSALLEMDGLYTDDPVYHYKKGMTDAAEEIATQIDARREG